MNARLCHSSFVAMASLLVHSALDFSFAVWEVLAPLGIFFIYF